MNKGIIKRIGIVDNKKAVKFWIIDECPYIKDRLCGYSVSELEQIAKTRGILSKLDTLDNAVRITIPPGRYAVGIFNV